MQGTETSFDYVVIGAGSAGCVVANRLSEDPSVRVCLIEAGPSDLGPVARVKTRVPVGNTALLPHAKYNWQHSFTGAARLFDKIIPCPRGRIFGGSSAVNGMVYIRGHRSDYDHWASLGNRGWSYDDVLPVFRRHENRELGADAFHGTGGELNVAPLRHVNPLSRAFLAAAAKVQLPLNDDFNGEIQDGVGLHEVTQKNGERWSSSRAFLHPALQRPNLTVLANSLVLRIVVEDGRATGVAIRRGGETVTVQAAREIVLAAGAINSPHLLMLSGIGPAASLADKGIAVVHDLPGVGENLQDHPTVAVSMTERGRNSYALNRKSLLPYALAALQYGLRRRGPLASNTVEAGGFVRSRSDLAAPDLQLLLMSALKMPAAPLPRTHGFHLFAILLRPESRGQVALASADPAVRPVLHPNFLEDEADIASLGWGVRLLRQIAAAPPLSDHAGEEIVPGRDVVNEIDLRDYILGHIGTSYHPVGTCKMGPEDDPLAVVDDRLRVRGIAGLRVADASIMPTIVGGNTNAPTMMIGEQCAAFIRRGE